GARPRGRDRARGAPRGGRPVAAPRPGRGGDAHARRAPARHLRAAGPPHRLRLPRARPRLPPELPALRRAAALATHGLLHVVPRRPRGPPRAPPGVGPP